MEIKAVRGVKDILPGDVEKWQFVERTARQIFERYGYAEIKVPIFEQTSLFARSIGEATDIVEKEMYSFEDQGGEKLTLRPEATAGICRAYVEHKLYQQPGFVKFYCIGPMFRYERPQAGRFRQFYQIDVEAIGEASPVVDAEVLAMLVAFLRSLGLQQLELRLNSLGDAVCRPRYREALLAFIQQHLTELCVECQRRSERNPLRVLDCKKEDCRRVMREAPRTVDFLCKSCRQHFETVGRLLAGVGISYVLDPKLVRGLDYYTRTTFEVLAEGIGAQNSVTGGGRYDGLIEEIGGPPTPGIGFAIGFERLVTVLEQQGLAVAEPRPHVFVAPLGEAALPAAFTLVEQLRQAGLRAEIGYDEKSLRSQLRRANKLGAAFTLLLGERELATGKVAVKDMQGGAQEELALDAVAGYLRHKTAIT
ncbi:MAG TPA: histidine--tRNA ligase [Alphaproteobacteria bacterium]|nr:histidine--tRNA ligase [Alphaproteobacteria bacterium]